MKHCGATLSENVSSKLKGIVERVVAGPQDCLIKVGGGGGGGRAASGMVTGQPGLDVSPGDVGFNMVVKRKQWSMKRGSRMEMKAKPSSLGEVR